MAGKIIQFKARTPKNPPAFIPEAERTMYYMEHEIAELTSTIPQVEPTPPRIRY
jgi:hypothetical protein